MHLLRQTMPVCMGAGIPAMHAACCLPRSIASRQMRTHEPLELLKLLHVVWMMLELITSSSSSSAMALRSSAMERVVILDQGLKVLLGAGATVDVERLRCGCG